MSSKFTASAAVSSTLAKIKLRGHEGKCFMERAYHNIGYFLLALPLIFVAGFWIPYLSEILRFDPSITVPVHLHALLLFAWVVLLVVKPLAIRRGAFNLHRVLGRISYVLMPLIVASAVAMLYKEHHEHLASGLR